MCIRDSFLGGHIKHLFHHIDAMADAVNPRENQAKAGGEGGAVAAKALHGVIITLRHLPDAHHQRDDDEEKEGQSKNAEIADAAHLMAPRGGFGGEIILPRIMVFRCARSHRFVNFFIGHKGFGRATMRAAPCASHQGKQFVNMFALFLA